MNRQRLATEQVRRLADDLRARILADEMLVALSGGRLTIDSYPRSDGFDFEVTVKVR